MQVRALLQATTSAVHDQLNQQVYIAAAVNT